MVYRRFLQGWVIALALLMPLAPVKAEEDSKLPATLLKDIVAPELLNYARIEAGGNTAYQLGKDVYGNYIQLNVTSQMPVKYGATASEIAINFPYQENETIRYSWRMLIPSNLFMPDFPDNRWWLLARWNDQANPKLGENPDEFLVFNPVMMIGYKYVNGHDLLNFTYGVPETLNAGNFGIKRDQWIKFTVEVTWSRGDKGAVKLYVNDAKLPLREINGPNMHGKYQNMFRLGIYRNAEIKTPASIQIGDVKIERVKK